MLNFKLLEIVLIIILASSKFKYYRFKVLFVLESILRRQPALFQPRF